MAETSIVIKAEDRYSDAVKAMSKYTKAFSKDVDSLEKELNQLSREKAVIQVDADRAKKQLTEARKHFAETGNEIDRLSVAMAQANYDSITRNLKLVTRTAADTERQLRKVAEGGSLLTGAQAKQNGTWRQSQRVCSAM